MLNYVIYTVAMLASYRFACNSKRFSLVVKLRFASIRTVHLGMRDGTQSRATKIQRLLVLYLRRLRCLGGFGNIGPTANRST